MPKPYGFTATAKIEQFLQANADRGFTPRELMTLGDWSRSQVAYALDLFLANKRVVRHLEHTASNGGGNYTYRYQWQQVPGAGEQPQ